MGVCSGIVTKNGYPATRVRVAGKSAGFAGGMTETVYTDGRGRFVLEWSSNGSLEKLYVDGRHVESWVAPGDKLHVDIG